MKGSVRRCGALAVAAGLGLMLFEGIVELGMMYPALLGYGPPRLLQNFRRFYSRFDRDLIQFNPDCAAFDPDLFYRLRPGRCAFTNREFDTRFEINSMGLRDDEASLHAPEVVVLGDSLAMGWGVTQGDTFAQQLERELDVPVLNAAISSYGTVREMKLLAQLDTSALRTLVIQYCSNDFEENAAFLDAGSRHVSRTEAEWEAVVAENGTRRKYVFGEHAKDAVSLLRGGPPVSLAAVASDSRAGNPSAAPTHRSESPAQLFLHALMNAAPVDLARVDVVIVPLESWHRNSASFANDLARTIQAGRYPAAIREAKIADLSPHLSERHYHLLDGHMNAQGHAEVAKRLRDLIRVSPKRQVALPAAALAAR